MQSHYPINLAQLQTQVRYMMKVCFWKNSVYWSSLPTQIKKDFPGVVVKIAYFKIPNWFGFNFCKYHPDAVEIFRSLTPSNRLFHEIIIDQHTKFKVWCIGAKHFDFVITQLREYPDILLEFVASPSSKGLVVPQPFTPLGLTFYNTGVEKIC